jgi:hypothetical protein
MLKFKRIRKKSLRNKVNSTKTSRVMEQAEAQKAKIKEIVSFHKKKAPNLGAFFFIFVNRF